MDFQAYQRLFAARLRDPRNAPRPSGVQARRMRVYERLLYNNIEGFLLACFPVCRSVLGQRRWNRLTRAFFREHVCQSPFFRRIPEEFLTYLNHAGTLGDLPGFLPELAHYEWVELDLDTSDKDGTQPAHDPTGDLLSGRPLLNPVMHRLTFRYPVHRLSPRFRPKEPPAEPTRLIAYRDSGLAIRFELVNEATARLLDMLDADSSLTGADALDRLARETGYPDPAALRRHGAELLDDLRARGVVLGVSLASCR